MAQANEGLHVEAIHGLDQVNLDYVPRITEMEEALARLVATKEAAESAARARETNYARAAHASRQDSMVADDNKMTASAPREEARTKPVMTSEAAGIPLLPKATPPTWPFAPPTPAVSHPFASAPPPQAAPLLSASRPGDEDAAVL